jgi:preprotein translocase subunit SecD
MNQYPLWKYLLILGALLVGLVYTVPNFYGESLAVQVQSKYPDVKPDEALKQRVSAALQAANINAEAISLDAQSVTARFNEADSQMKAQEVLQQQLGSDYVVLLNLLPRAPGWFASIRALPMYLGLDLRGGMHLLMQVDMKVALKNAAESSVGEIRNALKENNISFAGVSQDASGITVKFHDAEERAKGEAEISKRLTGLRLTPRDEGGEHLLVATFKQEELKRIQDSAIQQNLLTLRNRLNGMGLGEPVIQQQGADRIVIQLPGVQDPKRVHEMIGRTAILQLRMVDESGSIGSEQFKERDGRTVSVKREVIFTGERIKDARQGFDDKGLPAVHLTLDSVGAHKFQQVTRDNVHKRMAIILFEKDNNGVLKGEVVTAPEIMAEIPHGQVQISGNMTSEEARDVSLLLRSGALAAPMEIAEERTVGPTLGKENIARGFHSTWIGFAAITLFMIAYYMMFGTVSMLSLGANLLLLVALLSMAQATLTLPGMAGIALTLGMAIDSNVLINERIREELRNGVTPQAAIHAGYDRAFGTILDSNVTTFIAGFALLAFGSGPVKGFAVVLCLGILTSMFSAVLVSRALVNLIYGRRARLAKVAIG